VVDEEQGALLVTAIAELLNPIDVLVLNATGPQSEAPVAEAGWADHLAQPDFFVKSRVLTGKMARRRRRERP
jgi:3-oxoacyl-[acyl-carrier protein] reductase